jgi:hypothetical protein
MKKLLYIIPIGLVIYLIGYYTGMKEFSPSPIPKPGNQYELLIYQGGYTIMDGTRTVGYFNWENNPKLDSIIKYDNQ